MSATINTPEAAEPETIGPGICDFCGEESPSLKVFNSSPVAGACYCEKCGPVSAEIAPCGSSAAHDAAWEKHFIVPIAKEMKSRGVAYLVILIRDDGKASYVLDTVPPEATGQNVKDQQPEARQ